MSDMNRADQAQQTDYSDRSSGPRQRAIEAYDGARESVATVGRRASEAIEEAPLVAIAGGLAAGALIAALLPRTRTEDRLLRPVGEKVGERAKSAAETAKQAGTDRLKELGLTPDAGREAVRNVAQGVTDAARTSAQAAIGTAVRGSDQQGDDQR